MTSEAFVLWFEDLKYTDIPQVGGKNASQGEMIRSLSEEGVRVPGGFATTAHAYREFIRHNHLKDILAEETQALDKGERSLEQVGTTIRRALRHGEFPEEIAQVIREAYAEMCRRDGADAASVAVRSSATAEDLPEASFAGHQETYLNISGAEDLLAACRRCYASLFTDRAINYRRERGFDHLEVALSVGVRKMVQSDRAGSGVMFSIDTDTGFPDVVVIDAAWGLGETVVQGAVDPDEYRVFKPRLNEPGLNPILTKTLGRKEKKIVYAVGGNESTQTVDTQEAERKRLVLADEEILTLARWSVIIEKH
ncbi:MULTISPECIES: PEP/pyruvate-binding domain-containing protein [Kocuria]|uniref:Phosphoenolpyruvate synthase n=1 Tax=Kocuria subflava TaxID=1736139 RepID=A0A846U6V9_9MICC|nr:MULTISPECIES: PEP/pyruvate-binding domain-containing protein [Kocuria]NKE10521.1 hypothetical protein [Kocuria subflava]